jgi:hypothetical protein
MTVAVDSDALVVDLPLDRIERTGPSVEARAIEAGLDLWIDELDAVVPAGSLDGYGSPIWAALGDAFVRNQLARERGEEPSTDPFAFVRVVDVAGRPVVEHARTPWEPPAHEPMLGPPYWDDVPAPWEVEAAIGPGTGIVVVEMQPDRPPIIRRLEPEHQDPVLEARLPSPRAGQSWSDVRSYRDPAERRLRRGLRELRVDRKATSEVFAIHGTGVDVVTAVLHRVPGAAAADLARVFSTTVLGFKRAPWRQDRVASMDVLITEDHFDGEDHFGLMVTEDEFVAILGGPRPAVERMLEELVGTKP